MKYTEKTLKKLDKAVKFLSSYNVKRRADHHGLYREIFDNYFPTMKVSDKETISIVDYIAKHKLGYQAVVKKFGKRGLGALRRASAAKYALNRLEVAKEIVRLRHETTPPMSVRAISRKLHCEDCFVTKVLREYKPIKYTYISKMRGDNATKIIMDLYNSGERDTGKLANAANISRSHVYDILGKHGIKLKKLSLPDSDFKRIHTLKNHLTWTEIGAIYGVLPNTISSYYYNRYSKLRHTLEEGN